MEVEVLMSTMNQKKISDLKLESKNINNIKTLIINQSNNMNNFNEGKVRMYNFNEVGLSRSRNRAIENAEGEISIIADDDIKYKLGSFDIIRDKFNANPEADIITFQVETPDKKPYKGYSNNEFWHNKRTIMKVSSIEIAFRSKKVLESGIRFDENFGLGSKYQSGEENIFLLDCLNKGLKVKYVPIPIVIHDVESSGSLRSQSSIYSKGALFTRLFGWKSNFINFIFVFKKYNLYKNTFPFQNVIKWIYQGSIDFKKNSYKK